jgi:hypothetical protein
LGGLQFEVSLGKKFEEIPISTTKSGLVVHL